MKLWYVLAGLSAVGIAVTSVVAHKKKKAHISRDIRNQCFMWAIIMLAGALLSCFLTPYIAIPTYIIWLVLFFREVHFDNHKAFEKYLLK